MKELSLNVLDISQNSISAGATLVEILLTEDESGWLTLVIADNGKGMSRAFVERVTDPFCTTRTTRKVGMGLPLLKLAAEQADGELRIESVTQEENPAEHGTTVTATFRTGSIDCTPLGDMVSTMCVIIQGHPEVDYVFRHTTPELEVTLDTRELREVLGPEISLAENEVIVWISDYLKQQYQNES